MPSTSTFRWLGKGGAKRGAELAQVSGFLQEAGLRLQQRKHSAEVDRSSFASVYNYLFVRDA
jgi:hypothetical protein